MRKIVPGVLAALILSVGAMLQAQSVTGALTQGSVRSAPLRDIPAPLRAAWLRFHEKESCLDTESVFVFHTKGMEIWCRVRNEGDYRDIQSLVEPLRKSFQIDLYPTYAEWEKKPRELEDNYPPPSLWTNAELRSYLRDPFDMILGAFDRGDLFDLNSPKSEAELKRRMNLYCDQIREWAEKMWRLAEDLPPLAMAAYGHDADPDSRGLAERICRDHAREVGKYAGRLAQNLRYAFPRGSTDDTDAETGTSPGGPHATPLEKAAQIAAQAHDLRYRVHLFLHPVMHTVTITDLRAPRLIDLLQSLESTAADFDRDFREAR